MLPVLMVMVLLAHLLPLLVPYVMSPVVTVMLAMVTRLNVPSANPDLEKPMQMFVKLVLSQTPVLNALPLKPPVPKLNMVIKLTEQPVLLEDLLLTEPPPLVLSPAHLTVKTVCLIVPNVPAAKPISN